ncbi:gluconate 2-dehydrogenase subunit 3 family protein [Alteromonadaceae bacterium BrNp21-10]|nr:gluconate 2-dehydrogenase subunit 3 family protein [Alteromonadaceae bacterium BrNp21-10]
MQRRDFIKNLSLMLGGALSAPAVFALDNASLGHSTTTSTGSLFNQELALFDAIAETIIPQTDTPGAKAAKVGQFIHNIINHTYTQAQKAQFADNLNEFKSLVKAQHNSSFIKLSAPQQLALLTPLNENAVKGRWNDSIESIPGSALMATMKELTVIGFYTSELGATQVLKYDPIPGGYQGDVPYAEIGGAWAE